MARMHSRKHGKHGSQKPIEKEMPKWLEYDKDEVVKIITKLKNEGKSSSVIGMILRDQYGIVDVRYLGIRIGKNMDKMEVPEDMYNLLSRVVNLHRHFGDNKHDSKSKRGIELLESKIRRLGKYYSRKGKLESSWKYKIEDAKLLVK